MGLFVMHKVQFNQKGLYFTLKADMDRLLFFCFFSQQIRCQAHLKCVLDNLGNVLYAGLSIYSIN